MGWASNHIQKLLMGQTVHFRPRGNSMTGQIDSGQLVTVEPIIGDLVLDAGHIVLCKVRGREFLHLIKQVRQGEYLIGNNKGGINGWTARKNIFGVVTSIAD